MIIMVAAGFCVLLMFGALAVDTSTLYVENTRLQTALDAGVLAGASMLPDTDAAISEARSYIRANGYSTDNITFSFENGNMVITAQGTETVDAGFSRVMGYTQHNVSAAASAEKYTTTGGGAFDYLLFTGDPGYTLDMGGRFDIGGSVHANGSLYASPSYGVIQGAAEACNSVYCNQWTMTTGSQVPSANFIDMPDFTGIDATVRPSLPVRPAVYTNIGSGSLPWQSVQTFSGYTVATGNTTINCSQVTINNTFHCEGNLNISGKGIIAGGNTLYVDGNLTIGNMSAIDGDVFVDGDITINGGSPVCTLNGTIYATGTINFNNTFIGTGNVFAGGSINFKGGGMQLRATDSVCVYSRNANIYMVTGSTTVTGIVYAPNGDITVQGNTTTFYGNIIGNRVVGIPANLIMRTPEEPFPYAGGGEEAIRLVR